MPVIQEAIRVRRAGLPVAMRGAEARQARAISARRDAVLETQVTRARMLSAANCRLKTGRLAIAACVRCFAIAPPRHLDTVIRTWG